MLRNKPLFRKIIGTGLFASICLTAIGFGQTPIAAAAEPAVSLTQNVTGTTTPSAMIATDPTGPVKPVITDTAVPGEKIINTGKKFLGVRYRFGAPSGVTYAFDCSSFTQYVFKKNGIALPRTSTLQSGQGLKVSKSDLQIGDLVFFKDPGRAGSIGHVAVYAGKHTILHTGGTGGVKFTDLNCAYYVKNYVTARRVL